MNIHTGGGYTLLLSILQIIPSDIPTILLVDSRFHLKNTIQKHIEIHKISGNIFSRLGAEYWLSCNVKNGDFVLSFGNLPPLIRLSGNVFVYMQNRFLIEKASLVGFSLKNKIRISIERLWILCRLRNVDIFCVQTPTMKNILGGLIKNAVPIRELPFVENFNGYHRYLTPVIKVEGAVYDFVYVASGETHKNHLNLLSAWDLLAKEGLFPSLCLTVDEVRFGDVCRSIEALTNQSRLKVENLGALDHQDILSLYKRSSAVIYPSKCESLGLPLIEARQAGLPVLAPELDYVRDVLDPNEVFDPDSPTSIARSVKRFMGLREESLPLLGAKQFLDSIFQKVSP